MSTGKTRLRAGVLVAGLPVILGLAACAAAPPATALVATDTESVTHAGNGRVPEGAEWTQHYFPSSDGSDTDLHADVLLPEGLAEDEQVPVIVSVGAYFGHSGEALVAGDEEHTGPSDRFGDLIEGGELFDRGYALVMVDLRGFGGSSGCLDFMGPGEQADVKAAIEWAESQPWSTGSVGMYGKSYDAITGLVGNNLKLDALDAVVAQAPMWDLHRSVRSNGVPRAPMVDTARSYNETAKIPALPDDDDRYRANAAYELEVPECEVMNSFGYKTANPDSEFWATRDLAAQAAGTDTPLFFTQGLLESVTAPEGMQEFLANHTGPQRGWLGPWEHIRGNDRDGEGTLKAGREGWFDEVMAFYDEHLKGKEPAVDVPAFSIQDSTGSWRAQDTWPVVERDANIVLSPGSYVDDGAEGDLTVQTGNSYIQFSQPLEQEIRITGTPRITFDATGHGNVMVKLHDVAPDGNAVLFDEHVSVVKPGTTTFDLKSTDWTLPAGHVLAVEIGTIESGVFSNWIDTPSNETIAVTNAQLDLALDDPADDLSTPGEQALYLDLYVEVSKQEIPIGPPVFSVPAISEPSSEN
ncbi:CocE/NonD family hydrolase [Cryobacterium lactosi]|uniref:CocE/NonD family hydrolase n=1 Tax=Cryobacterium lactosi TaxID=1259202 RepID=A0A4V3IXQ6_9MICO|nr:CocE/NonD family hydrolase [Cryobacterium lactosi]TFD92057.1 CocE/NonD family hydrolase [Cryobacterium lactosi]